MPAPAPLDLLTTLIRCRSVTPEDGGALAFIEGVLASVGFEAHRPVFSGPGQYAVENLYARYGRGSPCLVFAGHTDVVPPGDESLWKHPPFAAAIDDGEIYGRGAADMKGGIACMMVAALRFIDKAPDFPGSIAFLITGDEEADAVNGTVKLLQWAHDRGERFDYCLLGEPTNVKALGDTIKIGRRGSLTGHLIVNGTQGHVGYPHLADNPIHRILPLLQALIATPLDDGTVHFDRTNLEITTLDVGNLATNVIPATARATFNVRFNDIWTPETLRNELVRRLDASGAGSYQITFDPTNAVAFLTEPDTFVATACEVIQRETGIRPELSTSGGTSDARFIKNYCPVIEFGLLNATIHQTNERVAVADLDKLTATFGGIIEAYFA